MKKPLSLLILVVAACLPVMAQNLPLRVGEIPGYITLKCDFHLHTVFSDGDVWPTVRVEEAEKTGLDVIAITDHIEYHPNSQYLPVDQNAAWKIAREEAGKKNIMLVHGAEITRKMPPGHFNALFIEDASRLTDNDFIAVVAEAVGQGAFIQWNHPGWKAQRPKGDAHLDSIHRVLLDKGWLNAIEISNDKESYRGVLPVCLEHHLGVMANSDMHSPIAADYYPGARHQRPITLVFATGRSEKELKEALFAGRTLAWFADSLAGDRAYAGPFVLSCLKPGKIYYQDEKYAWRTLTNNSDIPFEMVLKGEPGKGGNRKVSLPPGSTARLRLNAGQGSRLDFFVTNVKVTDDQALEISIPFPD